MMQIPKRELYFFGGIMAFFAALAYFIVPWFADWSSTALAYTVISILFAAVTIYAIGLRMTLSLLIGVTLIYLFHDVAQPPYLVTQEGIVPGLPAEAQLSSDVFVWKMMPDMFPGWLKYFMTFVFVPTIMLVTARLLMSKTRFMEQVF